MVRQLDDRRHRHGVSNLVFCSLAGYAFARLRFRGSSLLFGLIIATLIIPFQLTMIPTFIVMERLNLVDTLAALIIPGSRPRSESS